MSGEQVPARASKRRDLLDNKPLPQEKVLHLDRRIHQILPQLEILDPERLLNTEQTAFVLGCSKAFLEIGRMKGTLKLPFKRLSPRKIRYKVADIRQWCEGRTFLRTSEYSTRKAPK